MSQILSKINEADSDRLKYFVDDWVVQRAGKSSEWSQGDDQENYVAEGNLYGPSDIVYDYNSHGFRCDPFENNDAEIVFLGDSFTEGTGLPLQDVWCKQVHESLYPGTSYINLGVGGTGLDICAETIKYFWDKTKRQVKDIVIWVPSYHRRSYKVKSTGLHSWVPGHALGYDPVYNYSLELFTDEDYAGHQSMTSFGKIQLVAELMNANIHVYDQNRTSLIKRWYRHPRINHIDFFGRDKKDDAYDKARDGRHMGPHDSTAHANYIIECIREFNER